MSEEGAAIQNSLATLRRKRGLAAVDLARAVGVSRQTIYAIEGGRYIPNTATALRLARELETSVEDIFALAGDASTSERQTRDVAFLPDSEKPHSGQPVQLCRVDKHLVASTPCPVQWYLPSSDGTVANRQAKASKKVKVNIPGDESGYDDRILIAGCDPGMSVLARHAQAGGIDLVMAHRNSSQALTLLSQGFIHIAGTHIRDEARGESNLPEIGRRFPGKSVAVISFAVWEEGLVTAKGNPKTIRTIDDLARPDVVIVNREEGAGSRLLLDSNLKRLKINPRKIRGYDRTAQGHLPAAWQVKCGFADCCIATRAVARVLDLGFIPLVSERYDLVLRRHHLAVPSIQRLLDTLSRSRFRRELESFGGYDAGVAGQRVL